MQIHCLKILVSLALIVGSVSVGQQTDYFGNPIDVETTESRINGEGYPEITHPDGTRDVLTPGGIERYDSNGRFIGVSDQFSSDSSLPFSAIAGLKPPPDVGDAAMRDILTEINLQMDIVIGRMATPEEMEFVRGTLEDKGYAEQILWKFIVLDFYLGEEF